MKKRLALLPAAVFTALGLSLTGSEAGNSVTQELTHKAHKIEGIAAELKTEFRKHYVHLGTYRHLMSDLSEICAQAGHIDKLAHNPRGQIAHLRADVKKLDQLAHHLHEVVDTSERSAAGHVHGKTGHVHELLDVLNNTIHRLEDTLAGIASAPVVCHTRPPVKSHTKARVVRKNRVAGNFKKGHSKKHNHRH